MVVTHVMRRRSPAAIANAVTPPAAEVGDAVWIGVCCDTGAGPGRGPATATTRTTDPGLQ